MDLTYHQRYKQLLLTKRDELLDAGAEPIPAAIAARVQQGDYIDQANAEIEASLAIGLRENNARLLRAIDDALHRIGQGKFGLCEACEEPLSKARLEAMPWANLCRDCKERQQSAA